MSVLIAFLSLAVEAKLGYPDRLFRWVGHPVTWIGRLISCLDRRLNRATASDRTRRLCGVAALIVIVAVPAVIAYAVERVLLLHALGFFVGGPAGDDAACPKEPRRSCRGGGARAGPKDCRRVAKAVSMIVGRDPEKLDRAGVARAAIESLAENFSDGVVAPAFWMAVGGLAGGAAYKAVNTADSMIGHRTPKHEAFGWAAARFDDLVNLPASRLTALLIVVAAAILPGMDASAAWRAVWRDAKKHRSPNAGWPEAAMAGALGIALAGPRSYGGVMGDYAFMGEGGRREVTAADISRALRLFWMADVLLMAALGVVGLALVA